MKRTLLIAVAALAVVACSKPSPVDDQAASATIDIPAVEAKAVTESGWRSDAKDLQSLSIRQLNKLEGDCTTAEFDQSQKAFYATCPSEDTIDAEFHRRGWCAYDATGARKPHCTAQEIKDDEEGSKELDAALANQS